jgi:succinoglycan biosynthesis protein ExoA
MLPETALPFISVILPVRNEESHIARTLEQIVEQSYDPTRFEVIVVDGESTDATAAIARAFEARYENVRFYRNPRRLSCAARNIGVRHARGEMVVFIDGHCDVENREYLHEVASAFARSGADCLGRPQPLDVCGASVVQRAIAAARASWLGHQPASWIYEAQEEFVQAQSVAVAYRRSVFDVVGLFDESFDACEDVELNHRLEQAGLRCFFTPRIQVRYHPRTSFWSLFRQMARYGRGRVRLLRKHPDSFSIPCFVPLAFVIGLLVGPLLAWHSLWSAGAYLSSLALYGVLVAVASLQIGWQQRDAKVLLSLPGVFPAIHLGAGFGLLYELLVGHAPAAATVPAPSRLLTESGRLAPERNGTVEKQVAPAPVEREAVGQPETAA